MKVKVEVTFADIKGMNADTWEEPGEVDSQTLEEVRKDFEREVLIAIQRGVSRWAREEYCPWHGMEIDTQVTELTHGFADPKPVEVKAGENVSVEINPTGEPIDINATGEPIGFLMEIGGEDVESV